MKDADYPGWPWDPPPWEVTPWTNWHRWFGYSLRRHHYYRGNTVHYWEYEKPRRVAREALEKMYDR